METQTPPCADWKVWVGCEVEGSSGLGEKTLFIRQLTVANPLTTDFSFLTKGGTISRVWFCKEFTDWRTLRAIRRLFSETCVEVTPKTIENVPKDIRNECRLYLKVNVSLKKGDYVCVGPPFSDESFEMGTGHSVKETDYLKDQKLL